MRSTWMEGDQLLLSSTDLLQATLRITACLTLPGAALGAFRPSCVCTSLPANLKTAAGAGTACLGNATAMEPSGVGQPAMCWTVALPTALFTECARRWDVSVMPVGPLVPTVPTGTAVLRNACAATTGSVTLCTDPALAQWASKESSVKKPALLDAGPCLLQATSKEEFLFSKKAWVAISLGLLVLLLLSVLVNVRLALRSTNKHHEHGQYISVPLEEINGGAKDRVLPAAWEEEDPTEAAWDTNLTENVHLL
ncbi:hypothetical protein E2320_011997 [Naja naja]|nr:hypothetical protein E2320_011997 [Naja naja]